MCITYNWNLDTWIFSAATNLFSSFLSVHQSCIKFAWFPTWYAGNSAWRAFFRRYLPSISEREIDPDHIFDLDACVSATVRGIPFTSLTTGSRRRLTIRDDDACKLLLTFLRDSLEKINVSIFFSWFSVWAFDETSRNLLILTMTLTIRRFAPRDNRYVTQVISTNNVKLNSFYRREKLFAVA